MTPTAREPLYLSLADRIAQAVERGIYAPDHKLPSVRSLMRQEGVSLATVVGALQVLEDRGLIYSQPRVGNFIKPTGQRQLPIRKGGGVQPHLVNVQNTISHLNRLKLPDNGINLGPAVIAPEWTPAKSIIRSLRKAISQQPMEVAAGIIPAPGLYELRLQIARIMARRGVEVSPEEIIVTNGDANALEAALRAIVPKQIERKRVAAIEYPTYFGILQLLERNGIEALEITTDPQTGISLEELQPFLEAGSVGVIIVNPTFQNPFGCTMPSARKRALAELAQRFGVPIIEDDVFGDLHFDMRRPPSVKSFDSTGQVVYCSSFSKTLTPGWRIGWVVPGYWQEAIIEDQLITSTGVGSLPQFALAEFLASRAYGEHIQFLRTKVAKQSPWLRKCILEHFPGDVRVSQPEGGFLQWVELQGLNAIAFAETAWRHGIAIAPGTLFSAKSDLNHAFRISLGMDITARIEASIAELGAMATRHSSKQ